MLLGWKILNIYIHEFNDHKHLGVSSSKRFVSYWSKTPTFSRNLFMQCSGMADEAHLKDMKYMLTIYSSGTGVGNNLTHEKNTHLPWFEIFSFRAPNDVRPVRSEARDRICKYLVRDLSYERKHGTSVGCGRSWEVKLGTSEMVWGQALRILRPLTKEWKVTYEVPWRQMSAGISSYHFPRSNCEISLLGS